jgi:hypothetical protein
MRRDLALQDYWHREAKPSPEAIRDPSEFRGGDELAVWCTQTELSSTRQRALVKAWCDALPALTGVRTLWFQSKVSQSLFDAACQVPGLEGLWIKWSGGGIKDASAIRHATALKYFHLGSSTSLASIDPIAGHQGLEWLTLESLSKISDVSKLQDLRDLKGLGLDGSTWTTWHLENLDPIGELGELRYLSLTNLRAKSRTLRPLFKLRRLEALHLALWWDPLEVIEIQQRNPGLAG